MEELDYLIRTLTYQRSALELELKTITDMYFYNKVWGKIEGLKIAISEVYKLVGEKCNDDERPNN